MNQSKRSTHARRRHQRRAQRPAARRGVLLLVVLSMLVLFLLIGTTFLVTSGQYRTQAKVADRANRSTFQPADLLERALMQLVRDTSNPNSVIRHHSLLRDLYGTDGLVGRAVGVQRSAISDTPLPPTGILTQPHYAGVDIADTDKLGETRGQLVDLYLHDDEDASLLDPRDLNVAGLDFDATGAPVNHPLSDIDGYYEGCLITFLTGPCRGSTVRVVGYEHVSDGTFIDLGDVTPQGRLARLRIVAPRRSDGQPLSLNAEGAITDLFEVQATGPPIGHRFLVNGRPFNGAGVGYNPLALSHDLLNGVPSPRLSALEHVVAGGNNYGLEVALTPNSVHFEAAMLAHLKPNRHLDPFAAGIVFNQGSPLDATNDLLPLNLNRELYPRFAGPGDTDESYDAPDAQNMALASQALEPRLRGRVVNAGGVPIDPDAYYPNSAAPAYLDLEGVTIPSFHRPALTNFWFHRLINSDWIQGIAGSGVDPAAASVRVRAVLEPYDANGNPQFGHTIESAGLVTAIKRKFMMRPLREDHPDFDGSNPLSRYATTAIRNALDSGTLVNANGEITFPYWEAVGPWDVDNDGDGVPDSVWVDVGLPVQQTEDGRWYKPLVAMLVEDLDGRLNLNVHGSTDDLAAEQLDASNTGTFINRNLAQDYASLVDPSIITPPLRSSDQLAEGSGWGVPEVSLRSILSPRLTIDQHINEQANPTNPVRYETNPQYDDYSRLLSGRPDPGVPGVGRTVVPALKTTVPFGRYGSSLITGLQSPGGLPVQLTSPGRTFVTEVGGSIPATRDPRTPLEFLGYPEYLGLIAPEISGASTTADMRFRRQSGFGSEPDFRARYGVGLSATGGRMSEAVSGAHLLRNNLITAGQLSAASTDFDWTVDSRNAPDDSPYELDVSSEARRLEPFSADAIRLSYEDPASVDGTVDPTITATGVAISPLNDDAPFSPAELERLLRAFDDDADKLPDRLWEIVDAFDPEKLAAQELINREIRNGAAGHVDSPTVANSLQGLTAAAKAAINRRVVTTDSFDLPVPNENWGERLALGADGLPGVPEDDFVLGLLADDDDDNLVNEGDEAVVGYNPANAHTFPGTTTAVPYNDLFAAGCDDYVVVMREDPPTSPRITDYLRYRITLELLRKGVVDAALWFSRDPNERAVVQKHVNEILVGANDRPSNTVSTRRQPVDSAFMANAGQPALFSYGGLLAPELLSGLRMDLNRPLGDGRDNNGNGVVDEPEEAGEPYLYDPNFGNTGGEIHVTAFLDLNNNGILDQDSNNADGPIELYVDTDGDGRPDRFDPNDLVDSDGAGPRGPEPIVDNLWIDDNNDGVRDPNEFRPFDYTRGGDANGRGGYVDSDNDGQFDALNDRGIRDDGRNARQLYARHLYCLMLALMDENYVAPYDSHDPQVLHYVDPLSGLYVSGNAPEPGASIAYWLALELFLDRFATEISSGQLYTQQDIIAPGDSAPEDRNLVGPTGLRGDHTHVLEDNDFEARRQQLLNDARQLAMQKLTRRKIAQWAINVVDFRDPDAIQTPFEYDENPWDGWNVVDTQSNLDPRDDVVYPLDGDLATDENFTQLRLVNAAGFSAPGVAIDPTRSPFDAGNFTIDPLDLQIPDPPRVVTPNVTPANAVPRRLRLLDRTRGVVWGAERPEAILTEGMAWHDRRLEDLAAPSTSGSGKDGGRLLPTEDDDDLDQLRKPKGYLYLEAYNPWTDKSQRPAEFYSHVDRNGNLVPFDGIRFDRLSDREADSTNPTETRSPVWRLACVEEHPLLRNASVSQNLSALAGAAFGSSTLSVTIEASDDPPTPLNARSGLIGPSDYIGITIDGLPWAYPSPRPFGPISATPITYGNTLNGKKPTPTLSRAETDFWFDSARETFIGLATGRGQIDSGVGDADGVITSVGLIELPPRIADTTFPTFDRFAQPDAPGEWEFEISSRVEGKDAGTIPVDGMPAPQPKRKVTRAVLLKPKRFIERAFYMVSPNPMRGAFPTDLPDQPLPDLNDPGFRIPELSYRLPLAAAPVTGSLTQRHLGVDQATTGTNLGLSVSINKFASLNLLSDVEDDRNEPIDIAPLLPGRRAVIGTRGAIYDQVPNPGDPLGSFTQVTDNADHLYRRYSSILTQPASGVPDPTPPPAGRVSALASVRRIEMIPSPNANDHQVVVRMNGFTESQSALLPDGPDADTLPDAFNVTVGPAAGGSTLPFGPVISVPMEAFSISEPLDQYFARQLELDPDLDKTYDPNVTGDRQAKRPAEGLFTNPTGLGGLAEDHFDEPFDLLPELVENQTTPNYRAMHLERLANPLMPWNPPPMLVTGDPNEQHDPSLPVNPYLPVDAQSLDITSFNSFSDQESTLAAAPLPRPVASEFVHRPASQVGSIANDAYGPEHRHRAKRDFPNLTATIKTALGFSANERDRPLGPFTTLWNFQPLRQLWKQAQGATTSELLFETIPANQARGVPLTDRDPRRPGYLVQGGDEAVTPTGTSPPAGTQAEYDFGFDSDQLGPTVGYRAGFVDFPWRMTLGFPSWLSGEFHTGNGLVWFTDATADLAAQLIDLDGDTVLRDLLGMAEVNTPLTDSDADGVPDEHEIANDGRPVNPEALRDNGTTPAFPWPNRPFASAGELLQVPAFGGSRMLSYYSTFNWLHTQMPGFLHDTQVNPYNGEAAVQHDGNDWNLSRLTGATHFDGDYANDGSPGDAFFDPTDPGYLPANANRVHAEATNDLRFREMLGHFGHLLNFFQTARFPSFGQGSEGVFEAPRGASHFYRVLDYVHVPSRFVATDTLLNADVFGEAGTYIDDPRNDLAAPFNRVSRYREPGRVNLNTIVGRRDAAEARDYWSEVYDGLMHRSQDGNRIDTTQNTGSIGLNANGFGDSGHDFYNEDGEGVDTLVEMGHLGPAWRDVVLSRRGYVQPSFDPTDGGAAVDYSPRRMNPSFPTFFANPFRAPGEGANVPLAAMVQTGVDATLLRAHPISPGADGAWGVRGADDRTVNKSEATVGDQLPDRNGIRDDAEEAAALTLELGNSAEPPTQAVGDRLTADVVLARFENGTNRRGALPDTFLGDAFRATTADVDPRTVSPPVSVANSIANSQIAKRATPVPLFSGATTEAALDTERNSTTRYLPIQRMASLATTRSNVYAAWITIGFFEVTQAREDQRVWPRYMQPSADPSVGGQFLGADEAERARNRDAFFRVYPDGWSLGQELDLDIGQNQRHRGFYVIDRSRPVAFRPGEDANVAETILLRRRIE